MAYWLGLCLNLACLYFVVVGQAEKAAEDQRDSTILDFQYNAEHYSIFCSNCGDDGELSQGLIGKVVMFEKNCPFFMD